jgi:hypothetical protein
MWLSFIGFFILTLLPGAWFTFGLPLPEMPFRARLLIGAALSPFILAVEFYIVRFLGASFARAAVLLVLVNLPALYLVLRNTGKFSFSGRGALAGTLVLLITGIGFAPYLLDQKAIAYTGNPWMHAGIIYGIANGELLVEEPQVAGLRMSYPWAGHVFQALLSYQFASPPVINYIWTNLLWVLLFFGLAECLVAELGGSELARGLAPVWLFFGVNFVGFALPRAFRAVTGTTLGWGVFGDFRYTPWIWYFLTFSQMLFALAMLLALTYVLIREWPRGRGFGPLLAVAGLLLCGIGIVYPILYPAGCALIAGKIIAWLWDRSTRSERTRQIFGVLLVFLICSVIVVAHLRFVTRDRVVPAVHLSDIGATAPTANSQLRPMHATSPAGKAAEFLIVTSPLLAGLILSFRRCWTTKRAATIVLLTSALACSTVYVLLYMPFQNEYKFMFAAAIPLAPFPAMSLERLDRLGKAAVALAGVLVLLLAFPLLNLMYREGPEFVVRRKFAKLDVHDFNLRLDSSERFAGLSDAARQKTPINTILVTNHPEIYLTPLTSRKLYAPPQGTTRFPGVNITADDELVLIDGYDERMIGARRAAISALFDPHDDSARGESMNHMLALQRPVAIVADEEHDAALLAWLSKSEQGAAVYKGNGLVLWLVEPATPVHPAYSAN